MCCWLNDGKTTAVVRQSLEAERPARVQRIVLGTLLSGANDLGAGRQSQMVALDIVDDREFSRA